MSVKVKHENGNVKWFFQCEHNFESSSMSRLLYYDYSNQTAKFNFFDYFIYFTSYNNK